MASPNSFFTGVKEGFNKAVNYVKDVFSSTAVEEQFRSDSLYENDGPEPEAQTVSSSVAIRNETRAVPDHSVTRAADAPAATAERKSVLPGFLYGYKNAYTGEKGYDDANTVKFMKADNVSFANNSGEQPAVARETRNPSRPAVVVERPAPSSSVIFGGSSGSGTSVPATPSVVPAVARNTVATPGDRAVLFPAASSEGETSFSFSGAVEPATFGSRPITRYDSPTPAYGIPSTSSSNDSGAARAKAVVGFNTQGSAANPQPTIGYNAQRASNIGGRTMEKQSVQIMKPTEISEATNAGLLLKKGIVVICNLSGIPDKNTRIRFSDFLCGCCKGCDADFAEIISVESPNAVLMAVPGHIELKNIEPPKPEEPQRPRVEVAANDISDFFSYNPSENPKASSYFSTIG